ncbi:MAG TPA: zinc-finger domain-containing protein [Casimicrobiaceae bacterium]|nr:zinc-finger domain-containing protein [Casimicrobiaceae bacterium]
MAEAREMPLVVVQAKDLPVYCPNPAMPLWSSHPRVYLDVVDEGEVACPYCGTRYRLEGGAASGHR